MITVFVLRNGCVDRLDRVEPAWLSPQATEAFWVNIDPPDDEAHRLLADVFRFHDLAVEDAMAHRHHPKIESYDGFLYVILHGISTQSDRTGFDTQDVDFFLGRNYLVTVHTEPSPSIEDLMAIVSKHGDVLAEGPVALAHRIIDRMVDRYRPVVDQLEDRLDGLETVVFDTPQVNPLKAILSLKSEVALLRRVALPERDVVGRLARREFPEISEAYAYRFRDVYDHLVRMTDEATFFQDRVTGLLDAYMSTQSNRMNQVMKVLTVIATIFMPLTVLTGMYGMNVPLPHMPGGEGAQFWWILGVMVGSSALMLWWFRKMGWL